MGMKKRACLVQQTSLHPRRKTPSRKTKNIAATQGQDLAANLQWHLKELPLEALGRASGFRVRRAKKITPVLFVQAACLVVTLGLVSYRRWAALLGLLGQCTLSKQALFERMNAKAVSFLQSVLGAL